MKKTILITTLFSFILISCNDDDKPSEKNLIGKWNLVQSETYKNGKRTATIDLKSDACNYDYYNLKTNGEKEEVYHKEIENCKVYKYPGTWSYNANTKQITMVNADESYTSVNEVISLTDNHLKLKLISEDLEPNTEAYLYLKR